MKNNPLCKCGCKQLVKKSKIFPYDWNNFCYGHYFKWLKKKKPKEFHAHQLKAGMGMLEKTKDAIYRNKKWLYYKYWIEKKSTRDIGKEGDCSPSTIKRWLKRHKIPIRTFSESQKLFFSKNPSWNKGLHGNEYLKHYNDNKIWNKDITKKDHNSLKIVSEKLSGSNNRLWLGEKLEIICDMCEKKVRRNGLTEINRSEKLFCCQECRAKYFSGENHPRWQGGVIPYYGSNWYIQRRKALERDDHICQRCGMIENGKSLCVHHIIPLNEFEEFELANQLDNLITVCEPCHGAFEFESRMLVKTLIKENK